MTRNTGRPPHLVSITTDQRRFDTTAPAARRFRRTPRFDHVAREGVTCLRYGRRSGV